MTEQCKHVWHFYEESADGAFCVKGCHGRLSRDEAEVRLNATERLSAEMAQRAVNARGFVGGLLSALRDYADTLEGE